MRYVTDANVSGLARELREFNIDCQTIHMMILGHERSQMAISDPDIFRFLKEQKNPVTLITMDTELAKYCSVAGIPCIRIQDLVADHIRKTTRSRD